MTAFVDQYWQLLALGLVLAACIAVGWKFQKRILEPLADVLKSGERLSGGDWSTHVDEFVLPYLPSHKLIVTADQVYILRDEEIGPANVREKGIHRVVQERKLDVENIMQTWFLSRSDFQVPYSILEEKVRLAAAKDASR